MSKYVDIEALVVTYRGHTPDDDFSKGVDFVLDLLDSKPLADVRPVKRGRWIDYDDDYGVYSCSECEKDAPEDTQWNFCPNCGADMREENTP